MTKSDTAWIQDIAECPCFRPTIDEFKDPLAYLEKIGEAAKPFGICKVIPPLQSLESAGKILAKSNFKFRTRLQQLQHASAENKEKIKFMESSRLYTPADYEKLAAQFASKKLGCSAAMAAPAVETLFWQEMSSSRHTLVEYGSDLDGTAFSSSSSDPLSSSSWNLKTLPKLNKSILRFLRAAIPGVTEPMLYIGMLFSMFAWHVEDHYLYSINYHHMGAPKTWYGVPASSASALEAVVRDRVYFPAAGRAGEAKRDREEEEEQLYHLLLGKTTMFSPVLLLDDGVPVYRAVQQPGEFVVTFPRAYHAGFSHGFNCGEAVNFATADWLPFGSSAVARYALLHRLPLLSHEELVCGAAMATAAIHGLPGSGGQKKRKRVGFWVSSRISHDKSLVQIEGKQRMEGEEGEEVQQGRKAEEGTRLTLLPPPLLPNPPSSLPLIHIQASFVQLLLCLKESMAVLDRGGAVQRELPMADCSTVCRLCSSLSFLAMVDCDCFDAPICVSNHANELRSCPCGPRRSVLTHPHLPRMMAMARELEEDSRVREAMEMEVQEDQAMAGEEEVEEHTIHQRLDVCRTASAGMDGVAAWGTVGVEVEGKEREGRVEVRQKDKLAHEKDDCVQKSSAQTTGVLVIGASDGEKDVQNSVLVDGIERSGLLGTEEKQRSDGRVGSLRKPCKDSTGCQGQSGLAAMHGEGRGGVQPRNEGSGIESIHDGASEHEVESVCFSKGVLKRWKRSQTPKRPRFPVSQEQKAVLPEALHRGNRLMRRRRGIPVGSNEVHAQRAVGNASQHCKHSGSSKDLARDQKGSGSPSLEYAGDSIQEVEKANKSLLDGMTAANDPAPWGIPGYFFSKKHALILGQILRDI